MLHWCKTDLFARKRHKLVAIEHYASVRQTLRHQFRPFPLHIPQTTQQPRHTDKHKRAGSLLVRHHECRSKATVGLCHHLRLPTSVPTNSTHGNACRILQFGNGQTVTITAYGVCGYHIVRHLRQNLLQSPINVLRYHILRSVIAVYAGTQCAKHDKAEYYVWKCLHNCSLYIKGRYAQSKFSVPAPISKCSLAMPRSILV